ncbi:MAG: hypothetical protein ACI9P7_000580 [Candidatus Azotimanducaceae bacterium]|jgi:hypothetical protein
MRYVGVLVLMLVIWQSSVIFFGTFLQRQAEVYLAQNVAAEQIHEDLLLAYRLDARSPSALELLARTAPDSSIALDYLRRLTQLEPNAAVHWVFLFNAKARLGEFDDELAGALQNAAGLGPFEPGIQLDLIAFGSKYWLELNPLMRGLIVDAGERALATRALFGQRELLASLTDSGLLSFVCYRVPESPTCANN